MYTMLQIEDLEHRHNFIKSRVLQIDRVIHPSKIELQSLILEQIDVLDKLRVHYPHLYQYPQNTIFDAIVLDYKRQGISSTTLAMIYKICQFPEFNKYKSLIYSKQKTPPLPTNDYQYQGERHIVDVQALDVIAYMEANMEQPVIKAWFERKVKETKKEETTKKKEAIEETRSTIPRPPWLEGQPGRDSALSLALVEFHKTIQDCATRVYQYPPKEEQDDQWYAQGIRTLNALFTPGSDLKYVRDILSYLDISYEKHSQSIHSAMSKSKIRTATGRLRKLTREQIADIDPKLILLAIHILEVIPGLIEFCMYLLYEQKPYVGDFHLDRHNKLSESAFGSESGGAYSFRD